MIYQIISFLFVASIVGAQRREIPFPFHECIIHETDGSSVLLCDGPDSIPNRYIVKFKETATFSQITTHLRNVNSTLPTTDCSFGDWLPPLDNPDCKHNCTRNQFTKPASVSVDCGDGFVICNQCNYSEFNWYRSDRTQPSRCGFSYIYESETNSTSFRGYAAALSRSTLATVLNDPLVFNPYLPD